MPDQTDTVHIGWNPLSSAGYQNPFVNAVQGRTDMGVDYTGVGPINAIGTAKEFVESICKTILDERGEPYTKTDDLPTLVRKTQTAARLNFYSIVPVATALMAKAQVQTASSST